MPEEIEIGYQVFVSDGGEEVGAIRTVSPNGRLELVIYVENAGDFVVPLSAVEAVHSQKVILNCSKLDAVFGGRLVTRTTLKTLTPETALAVQVRG